MNLHRLPKAPFNLDQELSKSHYAEGIHPRVTALVRDPSAQILLLLPTKAAENANAFMFPQGKVERHQTPREALKQLLWTECRYESDLLEIERACALGVSPIEKHECDVTKIHYIVFVSMHRFRKPVLNADKRKLKLDDDHRKHLFVRGPNHLWSKIHDCRLEKKRMIVTAVLKAVDDGLLRNTRWSRERFEAIRGFAAS